MFAETEASLGALVLTDFGEAAGFSGNIEGFNCEDSPAENDRVPDEVDVTDNGDDDDPPDAEDNDGDDGDDDDDCDGDIDDGDDNDGGDDDGAEDGVKDNDDGDDDDNGDDGGDDHNGDGGGDALKDEVCDMSLVVADEVITFSSDVRLPGEPFSCVARGVPSVLVSIGVTVDGNVPGVVLVSETSVISAGTLPPAWSDVDVPDDEAAPEDELISCCRPRVTGMSRQECVTESALSPIDVSLRCTIYGML